MKYENIREEELKNKIAKDYFSKYDCKKTIRNIDFSVSRNASKKDDADKTFFLWAEEKKGRRIFINQWFSLF